MYDYGGMMTSISEYNQTKDFTYEMAESRLRKCSKLIESIRPGKLLDIGCSNGAWGMHWRSRGWIASGIDIDRKHVDLARMNGVDAQFCDLNAGGIPFPDGAFDLVFAGEVIEHLVDTDGFLSEVARCTKQGGHVIVTTPNLASFENRLRLALGMYPAWLNYNLQGSGHVRGYTPRVLRKQMAEHGLNVTKQLGNWVPFVPQHFVDDVKVPVLSVTGDWFPSLAMDIIVLAQKT
jgi:2-polyprenyl-3-methyl-5-hydroxy-6-metoxy-1,4-benzoquinol methylase